MTAERQSDKEERACGVCGIHNIPRGIDWPYWQDGRPVHAGCQRTVVPELGDSYTHFKAFWDKHAKGSMVCPSCLLCGQQKPREEWAISHAELPDIYICKTCVTAARSTTQPSFEQVRDAIAVRMGGHTIFVGDAEAWSNFLNLLRLVKASECSFVSARGALPK